VFFVLTALTLHQPLKHVSKHAARLMVVPVVTAASITAMSAVLTFVATSGLFPKALGPVLVAGTVGYLADVVAAFLLPDLAPHVHRVLSATPAVAEVWMVLYLVMVGVRTTRVVDIPR
jgi:hypothetical protein